MADVTSLLRVTVLLVTLSVSGLGVHGYPDGAPAFACNDVAPQHGNNLPQPVTPDVPFTVTPAKYTYSPGEQIAVTVNATAEGGKYRGVLLQARDPNNQVAGTFTVDADDIYHQLLACAGVPGSAVTHTNRHGKEFVTVMWTAPPTDVGDITFKMTLVETFSSFWVGITAPAPATFASESQV